MALLVLCLLLSGHLQGLSEHLKDPSCPSEHLKDPSEHQKDPACPSEHLKDPACPSEHQKDPACPSEHLKDPSEHQKDPSCPSELLKDPACPSEHLKKSDSLLLSLTNAQRFIEQHTYSGKHPVDCSSFMNNMLQKLNKKECKGVNAIILGDIQETTNLTDVEIVCNKIKNGISKSTKRFRIVNCLSTDSKAKPPNCTYDTYRIKNSCYIVLGCENNEPTHYERCDN